MLNKKLIAEFAGTLALLLIVVGSGIMGEKLAMGNTAIALLANSIATGAGLYVLISVLGSHLRSPFQSSREHLQINQKGTPKVSMAILFGSSIYRGDSRSRPGPLPI